MLGNWKKKQTMKHESDVDTNCNWCSLYSHKRIGTRTRGLGNNGRLSELPHCWDWLKYCGESMRFEMICCFSNSSEKPLANPGVKNLIRSNNNYNKTKAKKELSIHTIYIF